MEFYLSMMSKPIYQDDNGAALSQLHSGHSKLGSFIVGPHNIAAIHQHCSSLFYTYSKLFSAAVFSGQVMHVPYTWIINTYSRVTQSYNDEGIIKSRTCFINYDQQLYSFSHAL